MLASRSTTNRTNLSNAVATYDRPKQRRPSGKPAIMQLYLHYQNVMLNIHLMGAGDCCVGRVPPSGQRDAVRGCTQIFIVSQQWDVKTLSKA